MENLEELVQRMESLLNRLEKKLFLPPQQWFSIKGTAAITGLSTRHIRRAIHAGHLRASNQGTPDRPVYFVSREAIDEWMKEREAGPKPLPRRKAKQVEEEDDLDISFKEFLDRELHRQ
jgi:hypothetical protein